MSRKLAKNVGLKKKIHEPNLKGFLFDKSTSETPSYKKKKHFWSILEEKVR